MIIVIVSLDDTMHFPFFIAMPPRRGLLNTWAFRAVVPGVSRRMIARSGLRMGLVWSFLFDDKIDLLFVDPGFSRTL